MRYVTSTRNKYIMLFAGQEVCIGKSCPLGLSTALSGLADNYKRAGVFF